jgi:hypothetical protein
MKDILFATVALCAPIFVVAALSGVVALCEYVGERLGKRRFKRWESNMRS